jgi:hypothetical protein
MGQPPPGAGAGAGQPGMGDIAKYLPQIMKLLQLAMKAPAFLFGFLVTFIILWWNGGSDMIQEYYLEPNSRIFLHVFALFGLDVFLEHLRLSMAEWTSYRAKVQQEDAAQRAEERTKLMEKAMSNTQLD